MSNETTNNFEVVSSDVDRKMALTALANLEAISIFAMAKDSSVFILTEPVFAKEKIFFSVREQKRSAVVGESLRVVFGLQQGQFVLLSQVESATAKTVAVAEKGTLYRLQRRNNFRTPIPSGLDAHYIVRTLNGQPCKSTMALNDLSVGGLALRIEKASQLSLKSGDVLTGDLQFPGRDPLAISCTVKHLWPVEPDGLRKVGVEFQNPDLEARQTLLAMALQIHRDMHSLFHG
jgi:c-di-GMP-binding flagellar brake protein YcgR